MSGGAEDEDAAADGGGAAGRPEPVEVETEVTATATLHAARLLDPRPSTKPKVMATSEWFGIRARGGDGPDPAARYSPSVEFRPVAEMVAGHIHAMTSGSDAVM
ncbi:hypothetical protein OHA71_42770 [Streptomyces sp. NBC_00444]|uniref:hypothetical protein n=1 Tax=Streptomyces sp. NBC_00444 TaxID=2975744 RepID=UPI002E1B2740